MGSKTENYGCVNFGKRISSRKSDNSMIQPDDQNSKGRRSSEYSTAVLAAAFAIQSLEEKEAKTRTPAQDKKYGNGMIINRKQGEKPSRTSIFRLTSTTLLDAPEKVESEKRRKAKHKMEKTKSELMEQKVTKRSASSSTTD